MIRRWLFYALLVICLLLTARISEQHAFQVDLSTHRINTLSPAAARALDALSDGLQITAFVPDYPVQRAQLEQLLAPYLAHADKVVLKFIDPIKDPETARAHGVNRHGELHLTSGQRREVVGAAERQAIDLALNRLALRGERWIVGLRGHGEIEVDDSPGGIGRFVAHIERLGYRFVALDPRQLDALPENTAALIVGAPRTAYDAHTLALIEGYLADGGNLLWLAERPLPAALGSLPSARLLPGIVVDAAAAQYRFDSPDNAIVSELPADLVGARPDGFAVFKQAHALELGDPADWQLHARLQSGPRSWNETGELLGQIARNPELGEQAGPITLAAILRRAHGAQRQGLVLAGNRHFISNDQIGQGANLALAVGLVRWLTANQQLGDIAPPADLQIDWSPQLAGWLALGLMGGLPVLYLAVGLWRRARRRRA